MRPEVLELEGFTAFRERTRVEFADAELFALTGPTGAGKSSIIDAMIFALYGSVPRLGEKAVEPVISKGHQQARIKLDFWIGEKRYSAVRVVSRTAAGGATTKEARLECGEAVLAANVKDLNEKIRELIGLDFDQFTTCVALPQGEFARFLKQRPGERQDLLSQLLGLEIYDRVRARARDKRTSAEALIGVLSDRLKALAEVNKAVVKECKRRLGAVKKLQVLATKRLSELAVLQSDLDETRARHSEIEAQVEALEAVRTPDVVKTLAKTIGAAEKHDAQARKALDKADQHVRETKAHRDSIGDIVALNKLHTRHLDRNKCADDLEKAENAAADAAKAADKQEGVLQEAEAKVNAAQHNLDVARRTHAAHALRAHLREGEPCPVCEQDVSALPTTAMPAALDESEQALRNCQRQRDDAQALYTKTDNNRSKAEGLWEAKLKDYKKLDASLRDQPALRKVEQDIEAIQAANFELHAAEDDLDSAKETANDAAKALAAVQDLDKREWLEYNNQCVELAKLLLSPPKTATVLLGAWDELEVWARDEVLALQTEAGELGDRTRELARKGAQLHNNLAREFKEHDVRFDDDAKTHVATAVLQAQNQFDELRKRLAEKREYRKQAKAAKREAEVAKALEQHLNAKGFKGWLLSVAFDRLVSGASDMLCELSNGQYTFHHSGKFEFDVVDHANAGETRSAKTLSGGETFLASLALAITLAEHISDLAVAGTARLESIFLDEGFGALDGETLDTVATAIEELSTKGRTVGVVTHVADLAERVPVRFKVSKTAATATVERVSL